MTVGNTLPFYAVFMYLCIYVFMLHVTFEIFFLPIFVVTALFFCGL